MKILPVVSLILGLSLFVPRLAAAAPPLQSPAQNPSTARPSNSAKPEAQDVLPPAIRQKAVRYSRALYANYFGGVALSAAIYAAFWLCGFGVWLRKLALRASHRLAIQCLIFVPVFWIAAGLIQSPLDFYGGYTIEHRFGLSTQHFASWLADWGKALGLTALAAIVVVWILYRVIRGSPRLWWFWFWVITLPLALLLLFGEPYVIEPLFYKFTPLVETQPKLTARIEEMLQRAGVHIPASHIYEMNASSKTRALNAYVSGVGHSKRVVVWDTTLKQMTPDETLAVLAHETGHYVLHHVIKEFALDEIVALGGFLLGFLVVSWIARRRGAWTRIGSAGDLAGLPLLMLILTVIVFLTSPLYCGISRHYEHQADQYGLELSHGVVPNSNAAMVGAFRVLAKDDLADPDPDAFVRFWLFTHPPLEERVRFAEHYHPWAEGKPMKLLRKNVGK